MFYFANFTEINGHLFRFDTRIYLNEYQPEEPSYCMAAIVGKNPGSAKPTVLDELAPLELDGDRMLPFVRNRFLEAVGSKGSTLPTNAFIRVWNLVYLCDADLDSACEKLTEFDQTPICLTEFEQVPTTWFGWGGSDERLNHYKRRFLEQPKRNPFYYDKKAEHVVTKLPTVESFAKHTQGLTAEPIDNHLAEYFKNSKLDALYQNKNHN